MAKSSKSIAAYARVSIKGQNTAKTLWAAHERAASGNTAAESSSSRKRSPAETKISTGLTQ
jgi:DNA invertase Pin-like site-specific DNA recombinase